MLNMGALLIHSSDVPAEVREALRAAFDAEPDERDEHLKMAAHILFQESGLPCADVKELVGLTCSSADC
ncbi:MAG TPA: hypothetical protein VGM39_23455 [Kofleriaceae bacterium]|jgi:hypothetical protein